MVFVLPHLPRATLETLHRSLHLFALRLSTVEHVFRLSFRGDPLDGHEAFEASELEAF